MSFRVPGNSHVPRERAWAPRSTGPRSCPTGLWTYVFFSHEPHVPVPGTLLIPKSLKLQGSGWGPHPHGWSQGESDIHHHIWMPCAFSRFLSSVQGSFREVARLTLQQTESKDESPTVFRLGKH